MNPRSIPLLLLLLCVSSLPAGATGKRVLVFGDSITVGYGEGNVVCPDHTSTAGYPSRLRSQLASAGIDTTFLNFGECGERTDVGISRIDNVLAVGGDVIIIMEGTNDVSEAVAFETTLFNLNEMMAKAEGAGVEPLLASIIPRGPDSPRDSSNGKTYTIADRLLEDAQENDWAFADQFHEFWDRPNFFDLYYFDQLHPNSTGYGIMAAAFLAPAIDALTRENLCGQLPDGPCVPSSTALCLNQGRFRLEAAWKNFFEQTGVGIAVPQTDDTGAFYWFDPQNIELAIKVLDGRTNNGHFWVFYGALSNVEFTLAVKDTESGECKEYFNPLETFASVGDTAAFFDSDLPDPD